MSKHITRKEALVPGVLYCLFTHEDDGDRDGALVYWTGEGFMDESGDDRFDDWDYAVVQDPRPNKDFVVRP